MALVAKRTHLVAPASDQRGQISIFFSASLVVFVSIIAFVINVGLFVKAKINLQNATDAAAWSGAAVQSRQLTKIAYLNWEMRNIYKEWMYKYYVVGSLNTPMVENPGGGKNCSNGKCMDFRLAADNNVITGAVTQDPYNFPAVCIHIATATTNVCKRYAVPGLPELGAYALTGAEEASRSFNDVLIGTKINDCVDRSRLNMLVATSWAYNVLANPDDVDPSQTIAGQAPQVLADRQGAWPRAIELAMRIRNLEKAMNREPRNKPVCIGGVGSCTPINELTNERMLGNERLMKAFYSGFRNLGNHIDNEMKNSFALTELAPTGTGPEDENSASNFLIPDPYVKKFVDLKLMMVNYATFYAALISRATADTSGACDISKIAIPVPGYPLGFYKNPSVVTYYAVKGEAEFAGMFNPFADDTIKLKAFAAAKPMGGRIGPMLFNQRKNAPGITSRSDSNKWRSVPYISGLDVVDTPNRYLSAGKLGPGEYGPGAPLPLDIDPDHPFWIKTPNAIVGGKGLGQDVQFGIPNLVYDHLGGNQDPSAYTVASKQLFQIIPKNPPSDEEAVGLYTYDQFQAFRGTLPKTVTAIDLQDQISRVRAPTLYEVANYLIPTPNDMNAALEVDSFGSIPVTPEQTSLDGLTRYTADIYAPLHSNDQNDLLYKNKADVLNVITGFMRLQDSAMMAYVLSMNSAAVQAYKTAFDASAAASGAYDRYRDAANKISDIIHEPQFPKLTSKSQFAAYSNFYKTAFPKSCDSLAGQFWHFYMGTDLGSNAVTDTSNCPITLKELLHKYFDSTGQLGYNPLHYHMEYNRYTAGGMDEKRLFSAYMPGPYNGVGMDGWLDPPTGFPQKRELMRRNFYSTKLVPLDAVQQGGAYNENAATFVIHSEGELAPGAAIDVKQQNFENPLVSTPELSKIRH